MSESNSTRACKNCGSTERDKAGRCRPCRLAGKKRYREKNLEKCIANSKAWSKANPERRREVGIAYAAANKERLKAYHAEWRRKNAQKVRDWSNAYRAANPEKARAAIKEWGKANPEAKRKIDHNARAKRVSATGKLSSGLTKKLLKLQKGLCACCREPLGKKFHLDHILPIALGGTNTDDNIQLLRPVCNHKKHAKHPVDYMQSLGFLL